MANVYSQQGERSAGLESDDGKKWFQAWAQDVAVKPGCVSPTGSLIVHGK